RARAGAQLHRRPRPRAGVPRRQAAGTAAPGEARLCQRRPGDDRCRHPRRRARRRVRRAGRIAGRRHLGGAPARQAVRALDLERRAADGAGRFRDRRRPALPPGSARGAAAMNGRRLAAIVIVAAFAGLLALLLYGVRQSDRPDREALPSPLIGRAAPQFTLPLLHEPERQVASTELLGQPYLLNVWGSWCPACREEHAVLSRYAATGQLRIIGYNWKDEREDALRWLQQF